jgi:hypothetical protein
LQGDGHTDKHTHIWSRFRDKLSLLRSLVYKPLRAIVMGCGGTGKSFSINTIISIVRTMTQLNDSILVGVPTGAAAFNVQGSTLHHLLGINVGWPEDVMSETI